MIFEAIFSLSIHGKQFNRSRFYCGFYYTWGFNLFDGIPSRDFSFKMSSFLVLTIVRVLLEIDNLSPESKSQLKFEGVLRGGRREDFLLRGASQMGWIFEVNHKLFSSPQSLEFSQISIFPALGFFAAHWIGWFGDDEFSRRQALQKI